ncbi:HBS1-like protein, partial [Dinothrombium tinctorium]
YDEYFNNSYGHSVEDDYCVSPGTEAEFTYNRSTNDRDSNLAMYIRSENDGLEKVDEEVEYEERNKHESLTSFTQAMDAIERAKLLSCIEEMQNVVGDTIPDYILMQAAVQSNYNMEAALNNVLSSASNGAKKSKSDVKENGQKEAKEATEFKTETEMDENLDSLFGRLMECKATDSIDFGIDESRITFDSLFDTHSPHNTFSSPSPSTPSSMSKALAASLSSKGNADSIYLEDFESKFFNQMNFKVPDKKQTLDQLKPLEAIDFSNDILNSIIAKRNAVAAANIASNHQTANNMTSLDQFELPLIEMDPKFRVDVYYRHFLNKAPQCKASEFFAIMTAKFKQILEKKKRFTKYRVTEYCDREPSNNSSASGVLSHKLKIGTRGNDKKELKAKVDNEELETITNSFGRFAFGVKTDGALQMNTKTVEAEEVDKTEITKLKPSPESRKTSPVAANRTSLAQSTPQPKQQKQNTNKSLLEEYNKERKSQKPLINLVVIGHVDAGKSTLMGHLLYRLGCVSKKSMHRFEVDSKNLGKASFLYAWILDETSEERTRGITMDIAQSRFETPNRSVTLLDAPGHKDFIPNMITGAAQADVALLVVDATNGEFEAGFDAGGQTQEHTLLIRSLGVTQLAVVINKLDNVNWNEARYHEIMRKMKNFLKQAGFKEQDVTFVPCSGLAGENLNTKSKIKELTSWYNGPCLLEVIDSFKPPERLVEKPFRLCIGDVFKTMGSGITVSGRIEAGAIRTSQKVIIMPVGEQCTIKGKKCSNKLFHLSQFSAITIDDQNVASAFAGDYISTTLVGCDPNNVSIGSVLCDPSNPSPVTSSFEARIVVFHNVEVPLTKGFPVVLHYKSLSEQSVVKKLISQLSKSTGEVIKKKPRCLPKNSSGIVEISVNRPLCVELYKDYKELGRFMLRSKGATIAAGMITKIL